MTWIVTALLGVILLAPISYADVPGVPGKPTYAVAVNYPVHFTDLSGGIPGGIPDSVRMKMLALILRGEVTARQLVSDNNFHVAVLSDGRIFDAFTRAVGMTWADSQVAMAYLGALQYVVLP